MKKIVYVVHEDNAKGDCFDKYFTFNLEEAREKLENEAYIGYRFNKKKPSFTKYMIQGYEVDTDEIDDVFEYDIDNAASLLTAWIYSLAFSEFIYEEEYDGEYING